MPVGIQLRIKIFFILANHKEQKYLKLTNEMSSVKRGLKVIINPFQKIDEIIEIEDKEMKALESKAKTKSKEEDVEDELIG